MKFLAHILNWAGDPNALHGTQVVNLPDGEDLPTQLERVFAIGNGQDESTHWAGRSLSVGDVVEVDEFAKRGVERYWLLVGMGWTSISEAQFVELRALSFSDRSLYAAKLGNAEV